MRVTQALTSLAFPLSLQNLHNIPEEEQINCDFYVSGDQLCATINVEDFVNMESVIPLDEYTREKAREYANSA